MRINIASVSVQQTSYHDDMCGVMTFGQSTPSTIAGSSWLSIANWRGARIVTPAIFLGTDSVIEVGDSKPSPMLSAIFPFSGKHENGLAIGGVYTVGADVENVVELGFL